MDDDDLGIFEFVAHSTKARIAHTGIALLMFDWRPKLLPLRAALNS